MQQKKKNRLGQRARKKLLGVPDKDAQKTQPVRRETWTDLHISWYLKRLLRKKEKEAKFIGKRITFND